MGLIDSPACNYGFVPQDLNHLFWACPYLISQRERLYCAFRQRNLQDLFSIEYLMGTIDKSIAAIICKFILVIEKILNIRI